MSFEKAKAIAQARSYGRCEGCGASAPLDAHHRMTRGSGGVHGAAEAVSNDCRNLLMLCRICHDRTLADADACIQVGWVIERRSGLSPYIVPAKIHTVNGYGWWLLTADGGYEWSDYMNLWVASPGYEPRYEITMTLGPIEPDLYELITGHEIENEEETS